MVIIPATQIASEPVGWVWRTGGDEPVCDGPNNDARRRDPRCVSGGRAGFSLGEAASVVLESFHAPPPPPTPATLYCSGERCDTELVWAPADPVQRGSHLANAYFSGNVV